MAAAALAVAGALAGCGSSSSSPSAAHTVHTEPTARATHRPVAKLPGIADLAHVPGAVSGRTLGPGYWLTIAGRYAWVADEAVGLQRFDLQTGNRAGFLPLSEDFCQGMQSGFGALWVSVCGKPRVLRVDLGTGRVLATVPVSAGLADEGSLALTSDAVWGLTRTGQLVRIDPRTNTVVGHVPAPSGASALRGGYGSIWVTGSAGVTRLDAATGKVVARIPTPFPVGFLAVGEGGVWALSSDGKVARINPANNHLGAQILVDQVPLDGGDIAIGGGSVWARVSGSLVAQIDPHTNTVVRRYGPASGSGSVGANGRTVWISIENQQRLWRAPIRH